MKDHSIDRVRRSWHQHKPLTAEQILIADQALSKVPLQIVFVDDDGTVYESDGGKTKEN